MVRVENWWSVGVSRKVFGREIFRLFPAFFSQHQGYGVSPGVFQFWFNVSHECLLVRRLFLWLANLSHDRTNIGSTLSRHVSLRETEKAAGWCLWRSSFVFYRDCLCDTWHDRVPWLVNFTTSILVHEEFLIATGVQCSNEDGFVDLASCCLFLDSNHACFFPVDSMSRSRHVVKRAAGFVSSPLGLLVLGDANP